MPFVSLYCILNGLGCGMCYLVPLISCWEWYPERKGTISGLVLGGYGFGSFIFANVSTWLVNPQNETTTIYDAENDVTYFGESVANRVPRMIQTLAGIWLCFALIAILLITRKKSRNGGESDGLQEL